MKTARPVPFLLPGPLTAADVSRVIEMAWDDGTPFEAIKTQFALDEAGVMALMRRELKRSTYRLWRQRVQGRPSKHAALQAQALRIWDLQAD